MVCAKLEDVHDFPQVDVVIGGPPCQGFSQLNRDLVGFERRGLWREYLKALTRSGAHAFVMENVPGLLRSTEYRQFKKRVEALGYAVEDDVLNAADYGVPQRRLRAIVLGSRHGDVSWPSHTHYEEGTLLAASVQRWRTFRDAVCDLPLEPTGENWHVGRSPRPDTIIRYRAVPHDGGNRFQMQQRLEEEGLGHLVLPCFRRKPTGTTDVFGRLWWDRPSVTIRTEFYKPEKGRYLHPTEDRPITVREAARCMSFPDDFILPQDQSMTSIARQIGNAVPPLLAQSIAAEVASSLDMALGRRRAAA